MSRDYRLGLNVRATAWAWEQQLPSPAKLVLLALAAAAGHPRHGVNRIAVVSVGDLTRRTGLSRRTVHTHLAGLRARNLLVAEERVDETGLRLANRWHLNVDGLAPAALPVATSWDGSPREQPPAPAIPDPQPADPDTPLPGDWSTP